MIIVVLVLMIIRSVKAVILIFYLLIINVFVRKVIIIKIINVWSANIHAKNVKINLDVMNALYYQIFY